MQKKYLSSVKKTSYIIRYLLFILFLILSIPNSIYANQYIWKNCAHYFSSFPNYQNYKEPLDISNNGCHWGTWVTFANKIVAIEIKVGTWQKPDELFRSKDFLVIYKHPTYYQEATLDFLSESFPTDVQKKIAIYAMRYTHDFTYFLEKCYALYKQKKISTSIFETVLYLKFLYPNQYLIAKIKKDDFFCSLLKKICNETTLSSLLLDTIIKAISGDLTIMDHLEHDKYETHSRPFKLKGIFKQMEEEHNCYGYDDVGTHFDNYIPYYLIILDHPCYYLYQGNSTILESHECQSVAEKYWAIFSMRQIGLSYTERCPNVTAPVYNWYSDLIRSACSVYRYCTGPSMPIYLMEDVLYCRFPIPFKYPFFILDYHDKELQSSLDMFISLPSIPCGLKDIAKKIKSGNFATRQEMSYMEGYRKFRKTYFTLYETIPPRKDFINKIA